MAAVSSRIKDVREAHGLSQTYVADMLGIGQTTLSKYENGKLKLDAELLPRLAEVMRVDPCDFFTPDVTTVPAPSREDRESPDLRLVSSQSDDERRDRRTQRLAGVWLDALTELDDEDAEKVRAFAEFLRWEKERGR
jgi:transcriptional regulator with XRE-family HTH domain